MGKELNDSGVPGVRVCSKDGPKALFPPGLLGDVGERGNLFNGSFDLQRQIGNGALLSRLVLGPGAIWIALPAGSSGRRLVDLHLLRLRRRRQVRQNRNSIDEFGDSTSDNERGTRRRDIGVVADAIVAFFVGEPFLTAKEYAFDFSQA